MRSAALVQLGSPVVVVDAQHHPDRKAHAKAVLWQKMVRFLDFSSSSIASCLRSVWKLHPFTGLATNVPKAKIIQNQLEFIQTANFPFTCILTPQPHSLQAHYSQLTIHLENHPLKIFSSLGKGDVILSLLWFRLPCPSARMALHAVCLSPQLCNGQQVGRIFPQ